MKKNVEPTLLYIHKLNALQYLPTELKIQSKLFSMIYKNLCDLLLSSPIFSSFILFFVPATLTFFLSSNNPITASFGAAVTI